MSPPPPAHVLDAFGVTGPIERLPGGQGSTYASAAAVLKPVERADEAAWVAELFTGVRGDGFSVPRPIRARDGAWCVDQWVAWERVPGHPAGPNGGRWPETIAACESFHRSLGGIPRPAFLDLRTDPWSIADRITWDELDPGDLREVAEPYARLRPVCAPVSAPSQLIHGDFTANLLFARGLAPAVIDFSPYWRPAGFAVAIVVVDALTWAGATRSILELVGHIPEFPQLLVRAEMRRLLEVELHDRATGRTRPAEVAAHLPVVELVCDLAGALPAAPTRTCPRCGTRFRLGHLCPTCYDTQLPPP